jgi:hypothetical protein
MIEPVKLKDCGCSGWLLRVRQEQPRRRAEPHNEFAP